MKTTAKKPTHPGTQSKNTERLAKQDGKTTKPKPTGKPLPKQQQQAVIPRNNGNASSSSSTRNTVTNNSRNMVSNQKTTQVSRTQVPGSTEGILTSTSGNLSAIGSVTQPTKKSVADKNSRLAQIEKKKALALQRFNTTPEEVLKSMYAKNMKECLPAHKLGGTQKLTFSGLLLDKSCDTTRFGEKGGPTKWTVMVFHKFDAIPPSCGKVSPNGNYAEIPVSICTNPNRKKGENKHMVLAGTIPFGAGIYIITVMATNATAPIVEELNRNPSMKMVTVAGLRAEQYTNPNNGSITISYLADNILFERDTEKSSRTYFKIPGGIPALLNQILTKVFPEPIVCSLGTDDSGVVKEDNGNLAGDTENANQNEDHLSTDEDIILPNYDDTNANLSLAAAAATAPVVVLSPEEQKKEDARKEAERTAAKKQRKEAIRKKLSQVFVYTGYNCSHVFNFGPDPESQQSLFEESLRDNATRTRLRIDRIPHDVGKLDPKTRLPSQTTDFYCVTKKDGQLPKCKPIFQTGSVVSANWKIDEEIFTRCYEQCAVVLPAFKSGTRTFLEGAVGTGSPWGIEVYMAHADKLSISVIAFPGDPEPNNSSYKLSDPTRPTYQVSLLASEFTSNIAYYVLQEQGIPISIKGMIGRLVKAWTIEGPRPISLAKVKFQGEKVLQVSLEITDETVKKRWPDMFAAGTNGQLLDAFAKNPTNQRWTRTKRNAYTASKQEGQWNRGYYLITEGNIRFTNTEDFKGKRYYSLPAVLFPQQFHKFLRTLSHESACQITDILFDKNLNPDSLEGDTLRAFELLKFPEEFNDFVSTLPDDEAQGVMSLFYNGLPTSDGLEGNALLAFELMTKIGYDSERYKEFLSLDTFPELTYEFIERDIPDILNFGTNRSLIPGKKLANPPFAIGTGIANQYKGDMYYNLCAGYKLTEGDPDRYYEEFMTHADNLKEIVPTVNLWSRVDDDGEDAEEEEEEERVPEEIPSEDTHAADQDNTDLDPSIDHVFDNPSPVQPTSIDNDNGNHGDNQMDESQDQSDYVDEPDESQIDDLSHGDGEFTVEQSQDLLEEEEQYNDSGTTTTTTTDDVTDYEDVFDEDQIPQREPVKQKSHRTKESSKLGEKRNRNQTKNSSRGAKRQKLTGDFE